MVFAARIVEVVESKNVCGRVVYPLVQLNKKKKDRVQKTKSVPVNTEIILYH